VGAGQKAFDIAIALADLALLSDAGLALGRAYLATGDYRRARDLLHRCIQADDGRQGSGQALGVENSPAVLARAFLAGCGAEVGQFEEASADANEAVQMAEAAGQGYSLIVAHSHVGYVAVSRGQLDVAIAALTRAVEGCETWRIPMLLLVSARLLGRAYALAGRTTEAVSLLERTAWQAARNSHYSRPDCLVALGEAHLLSGHAEAARGPADEGLHCSRDQGARGSEAWALRLLGEIAAQADPPNAEQAEAYYQQALARAGELGMRPLVAHCHLGLGTLYGQVGRREQAQAELTTAVEMYRAMGMSFWLTEVEAALVQVIDSPQSRA
jgi:tetratricopeptide (TPR) repeat protein